MKHIIEYSDFLNEYLSDADTTWNILSSIEPKFRIVSLQKTTTFWTGRIKILTKEEQKDLNAICYKIYSYPSIKRIADGYWNQITDSKMKEKQNSIQSIYNKSKDLILTKEEQNQLKSFSQKILNNE